MKKYSLAIHGGAGTISRGMMSAEQENRYKSGLLQALEAGTSILSTGGSSLDAVEAAVTELENNILFNAGRGSVFNHIGKHEMDASIMHGRDRQAGSVTCVKNIQNPIKAARAVLDKSDHVLLSGHGAEIFARELNLGFQEDAYFHSDYRYQQWKDLENTNSFKLDHSQKKFGTVGAVALDKNGDLAAATSTGGLTNKKWGRIGDTPIIGAGTFADNKTCAISCTGYGEYFMRFVVAYDISCLMEYKGLSLKEACKIVVMDKLVKAGGEGGLIAVDKTGNIEMPFNSEGMYRGWSNDETSGVEIYGGSR